MNDDLTPNLQADIEKVIHLSDFQERVGLMARREVLSRRAKNLAQALHHEDIELTKFDVGGWNGLALEDTEDCPLCLGPMFEGEHRGFYYENTFYLAHLWCCLLARRDGVALVPVDEFTGQRGAADDLWAHRISKCAPEWCVFCRESGA